MHGTFSRDHIASSCKHSRSFVQWKLIAGLLVLALMLSMGSDALPTAHGQYGWSNDAPPENPWQIEQPEEDEADDDPWGTNDPWGTEDAWGDDNSWNEDEAYGGGSDWARDFYDFDDGSSGGSGNGSAERVGDGVAMNAITCSSNLDCSGNRVCCTDGDGNTSCGSAGGAACTNGPSEEGDPIPIGDDEVVGDNGETINCSGGGSLPTECEEICQSNPSVDCASVVPIPGIAYLLALGLAFGAYKLT